jgi:hypothetical protein
VALSCGCQARCEQALCLPLVKPPPPPLSPWTRRLLPATKRLQVQQYGTNEYANSYVL